MGLGHLWEGGEKDLGPPTAILSSPCPTDGVQEVKVKAANLSDIVPNTESETKVSIQGDSMGEGTDRAGLEGTKHSSLTSSPFPLFQATPCPSWWRKPSMGPS